MTLAATLEAVLSFLFQIFVIFPYSALTIRRQKHLHYQPASQLRAAAPKKPTAMISEKVYKLCNATETVSSLLATDPTISPGDAWKKLYGGHTAGEKASANTARDHRDAHTPEDLKRALDCGKWGPTEPSELFLRVRPWNDHTKMCVCIRESADHDQIDVSRCHMHS